MTRENGYTQRMKKGKGSDGKFKSPERVYFIQPDSGLDLQPKLGHPNKDDLANNLFRADNGR
jgi:hypothetical protein